MKPPLVKRHTHTRLYKTSRPVVSNGNEDGLKQEMKVETRQVKWASCNKY